MTSSPPPTDTVEALVRHQLGVALGGVRGVVETAVPTLTFTTVWLLSRQLGVALGASVAVGVVELAARLVQRQTVKFCVNSLVGIAVGSLFVYLAARRGGSADDQALAYFVPGLLYNIGYAIAIALTCLTGWPLVGFVIGSVTGDPTAWHDDRQVVRLCSRLTWLLVLPCAVRALVQGPIWLAGHSGSISADSAVTALGVLKVVMGWPLQLAALGAMSWLLSRNHTPLDAGEPVSPASGRG
ncbi:MAG TPA: DUF3159 domain-containing protein [Nocardioides sp.]|jgi:hypothetical protein|uniref:DUF3159 domain-containing protein n=1 Tax=Nocardioides sp. TaxID=35761 RepID=UPI002E30190A|nr:DUF3159 domain-containing protein [Nocardioides sp.]HEX3930538.1 DUF3159 domain-containing protein [Nocardioides sp.]